jgi:hypothetical protein
MTTPTTSNTLSVNVFTAPGKTMDVRQLAMREILKHITGRRNPY